MSVEQKDGQYLLQRAVEEYRLSVPVIRMAKAYDDIDKVNELYVRCFRLKNNYKNDNLDSAAYEALIERASWLRKSIRQIANPESFKIPIWPTGKMPTIVPYTSEPKEPFYWDEPGFTPYLIPYLLDSDFQPKGAIIISPGGGYVNRSSAGEGDAYATYFNKQGYQAFVLEYRVAPCSPAEAHLDLQRAIRFVRYHAEQYHIPSDRLVTVGSSAGGMVCIAQANELYGDIQPNTFIEGYEPDEIDQVSADVCALIGVYTGLMEICSPTNPGLALMNPSFPPTFLAYGNHDFLEDTCFEFAAKAIKNKVPVELHIFEGVSHGFGLGISLNGEVFEQVPGANQWPDLATIWLDKVLNK